MNWKSESGSIAWGGDSTGTQECYKPPRKEVPNVQTWCPVPLKHFSPDATAHKETWWPDLSEEPEQ
jgi:hypothetical protein